MKTALQKLWHGLNTKLGFFLLVVLLFAIKSYWAYSTEFNLGVKGSVHHFYYGFFGTNGHDEKPTLLFR